MGCKAALRTAFCCGGLVIFSPHSALDIRLDRKGNVVHKALGNTVPESVLLRTDEVIPVNRFILLLADGAHPLSSAFQRPL
jgi:hypothetical protein